MAFGQLGRVALEVDDLEAVVADLRKIFGMEMEVHGRASEDLGIIAGVGHDGVELVQRTRSESPVAKYWKPPLAALVLAVDDLEEAHERMKAAGIELVQTIVTGSGFREAFYGDNFHGLPMVLYQKDEVDRVGEEGTGVNDVDWNPTGVPKARPKPVVAA
jgi:hypothetical protein